MASVGERIAAARVRAGLRKVEDAIPVTGLSRNFLYQLERIGNRRNAANPTLEVLEQIATAYGVSVGEFFEPGGASASSVADKPAVKELLETLAKVPEPMLKQIATTLRAVVHSFLSFSAAGLLDRQRDERYRDEERPARKKSA